jgi:hypothetical protein
MVGIEQYRVDFPFGSRAPIVPIPIIPTPTKGLIIKKKHCVFEYSFLYTTAEKSVHIGSQVLENGSFIWANCLFTFMDLAQKYPIELSLNAMLENLVFEVDEETLQLKEIIENLEIEEQFSWVLYGKYQRPDNLGDILTNLEILSAYDKDFLQVKIKPSTLKDGDSFKVLFTLKKPAQFPLPPYAPFGISGHGIRTGIN